MYAMADGIGRDEALALLKPERRGELRERAHETTPGADFDDDRHLAVQAGYSVGARKR